jgi:hypothetical protein
VSLFNYSIKLNGKPVPGWLEGEIRSVEWVESIDELDALSITFNVPSGTNRPDAFALAEAGPAFELTVSSGTGTLIAMGDIVECSIRSTVGGNFEIVLRGLERLHRLRGSQAPKLWTGAPNTWFSTIASRHGLTAKAQGVDGNAPSQLQASEDDAMFLKRIARQYNYYLRVEGKQLQFGRRHVPNGAAVTVPFDRVLRMNFENSLFDAVTKVTVIGSDPSKANPEIRGVALPAKLKKISKGADAAAQRKSAFGERHLIIASATAGQLSLAQALAAAELQKRAETFVVGSIEVDGTPTAGSGQSVTLKDAPWPLNGPFLIRQARHSLRAGAYTTTMEFISDSLPQKPL